MNHSIGYRVQALLDKETQEMRDAGYRPEAIREYEERRFDELWEQEMKRPWRVALAVGTECRKVLSFKD